MTEESHSQIAAAPDSPVPSVSLREAREAAGLQLAALAATLNEETDTLVDVVEPYLLKIGFLARTPQGRRLTQRAWRR